MRKPFVVAAVATLAFAGSALAQSGDLKYFKSETGALQHCPKDVVVWGSIESGVFFSKGTRRYEKTKDGHYLCKSEAVAAGLVEGTRDN